MRLRIRTWALISAMCFIAGIVFWKMGDRQVAQRAVRPPEPVLADTNRVDAPPNRTEEQAVVFPADLIISTSFEEIKAAVQDVEDPLRYRLSNTEQTAGQLGRNEKGLLLRNALIDPSGEALAIPQELRLEGDPGSYIVQSAGKLDNAFRALLRAADAKIVSYVPNNAYLVRVSANGAQRLAASPRTQSVLPYEPYFKLDHDVLARAIEGKPFAAEAKLRVTLFPGELEAATDAISRMEARILGQERSPFGPELVIQMQADHLVELAQLRSVQNVEFLTERVRVNDMARVRMGISDNTTDLENNFGLSGTNVYVNVNDSGVDVNHPDLVDRVIVGTRTLPTDQFGHGTHVAGIIASSGENGPLPGTNAVGSIDGANFRGMAPASVILSLDVFEFFDWEIQETAARTNWFVFGKTNALISNNSWAYNNTYSYNSAAASFDAAVRDAIPGVTGSQPILFVFAAGNDGSGNNQGTGGFSDSINSPATAKNVITVGALEQPRNITNLITRTNEFGQVSQSPEFLPFTDSSNRVSGFSGRGNVGVRVEGDLGRFKPDVVAPGNFMVSTRSGQWDTNAYYHPTNITVRFRTNMVVNPGKTNFFSISIPRNAVEFRIDALPNDLSTLPFPSLLLYTNVEPKPSLDEANLHGENSLVLNKEDAGFVSSVQFYYDFVNTNSTVVHYDVRTVILTTNDHGDLFEVLEGLNEALNGPNSPPPHYRYETGTSMAAPVISGLLALLQEYLETRISPGISNASPALMKALLINSARSAGPIYDLNTQSSFSAQGWGLPNLGRMLPGATPEAASLLFFDQATTNAVATDEVHTREVGLSEDAQFSPIRFSLVWTDPPGNPAVGIKLVNDLDLVVTNLDTGDVYFGNHFPGGGNFSEVNLFVEDTNQPPFVINGDRDFVNNVENIYINSPLGTRYAVSVIGRRVNVNAVTTQTNAIKQDYALVISSGNLSITNALSISNFVSTLDIQPNLIGMTNLNGGVAGAGYSLSLMLEQRVGANNPYELQTQTNGTLNQWTFYTFTNTSGFTNVAFALFGGRNLSGIATRHYQVPSLRNLEADMDLYVSTNSALLTLDPVLINSVATLKSVGRGGNELIVLTNAAAIVDHVYYIGVKSEDQRAADFGILAIASELPFASATDDGILPIFFPMPQAILDGSPDNPGRAEIFGVVPQDFTIRRLIVTNSIDHQLFGDLVGVLYKQGESKLAILNNHGPMRGESSGMVTNIYNDLDEGDSPDAVPSDGPGNLADFVGEQARGLWSFTISDNALSHTGQVLQFSFLAEPQPTNNVNVGGTQIVSDPLCRRIFADNQRYDSISVPSGATNLTLTITSMSGSPLEVYVRRGLIPTRADYDKVGTITAAGQFLSLGLGDAPPLRPGTYYFMIRNPGLNGQAIDACWVKRIGLDLSNLNLTTISQTNTVPLIDDALTNLVITVTNVGRVADVQVGVRVDHPRVADLSMHLVSPSGTRILLFENRGWMTTNGLGTTGEPGTNLVSRMTSAFDSNVPATYTSGKVVDGWSVDLSQVTVANNPSFAHSEDQFLLLRDGAISRTLPTIAGSKYELSFAHRQASLTPINWWPGNNATTDIIGGQNGTLQGGATYAAGNVGNAFSFDGTNAHVDCGTNAGNFGTNDFTIDFWIRTTTTRLVDAVMSKRVACGQANMLDLRIGDGLGNGKLVMELSSGTAATYSVTRSSQPVNSGVFHHIAFVRKGRTLEFYIDGTLDVSQTTAEIADITNAAPLWFGRSPCTTDGTRNFAGQLDEIAFYNQALTANDILELYLAGSAGKCGTPTPPTNCPPAKLNFSLNGVTNQTITPLSVWSTNTTSFVAPADGMLAMIEGLELGVALDTFSLIEEVPHSGIFHLMFTENTNFFPELIKFAQPPFGTNTNGFSANLVFTNSFETASNGIYQVGSFVEDWTVMSSNVAVWTEPEFANSGTNLLAINCIPGTTNGIHGRVSTNIPSTPGRQYVLNFSHRRPHSSLVHWWPGDNTTNDIIGGEHAKLVTTSPQLPGYEAGLVNQAFALQNNAHSVHFGTNTANFGTNDFTMDFWIRFGNTPWQAILHKRTNCLPNHNLLSISLGRSGATDNKLRWEMAGNGGVGYTTVTSSIPLIDNSWYHVAFVRRTNDLSIYVNGNLDTNVLSTTIINITNQAPLKLSDRWCGAPFANFQGRLDEFGIHNRAISSNEIRSLFLAGSAGRFDSSNPPTNAPTAQANIIIDGVTNRIIPTTNWTQFTMPFTPVGTNVNIVIAGVTNGVWFDAINLVDVPKGNFYLPEESLRLLTGERAQGDWRLEVWDTRLGAALDARVVSWQLQLTLLPTVAPPLVIPLRDKVPYQGAVVSNEFRYFVVDVPATATAATNTLTSLNTENLELIFNQNSLPGNGPGDVSLLTTSATGVSTLTSSSTPAMQPGQRYYLAVRNTVAGQSNYFEIKVEFEIPAPGSPSVTQLANGVASSARIPAGFAMHFYQFGVSAAATSSVFEVLRPTGDVDLYLRRSAPLPSYNNYHYVSRNAGTSDEVLVITPSSEPVPLEPGTWYVGVLNRSGAPVSYLVRATEFTGSMTTNIIAITAGVPLTSVAAPGSWLTNFYRLIIDSSQTAALMELYNLNGDADIIVRRGALPTLSEHDFRSENGGTSMEQIVIRTNAFMPDISGEWFIGIPNKEAVETQFTLRAIVSTDGLLPSVYPIQIVTAIWDEENAVYLEWNSVSTQKYEVQASADLINWFVLDTVVATETQSSYASLPSEESALFYRVVQVP